MSTGQSLAGASAVLPAPAPWGGGEAGSRRRWDVLAAVAALPLVGLAQPLAAGATTATFVVAALAPVWLACARRAAGVPLLLTLAVLAVPAGVLLEASVGPGANRGADPDTAVATSVLLLTGAGAVGVVLWARSVLPLAHVAALVGAGMLLEGLLEAGASPNPWKYSLSFPLTLLLLGLLHRRPLVVSSAALVGLALVGVLNESRSFAGFCVLTAALVAWRGWRGRRASKLRIAAVIAAVALAAYQLGVELLVQGYLGEVLQERSEQQVENAGSLIAGGRPEWAATRALFEAHPLGFGLGAVPTPQDVRIAKTGLDTVGISSDNGYVDNYMFGGRFKLHAIVADLWASFGLVGVALGALLVGLVTRGLAGALAVGRASPLVVFLPLMALWWCLFGPMQSNFLQVCVVVGLCAHRRDASAG